MTNHGSPSRRRAASFTAPRRRGGVPVTLMLLAGTSGCAQFTLSDGDSQVYFQEEELIPAEIPADSSQQVCFGKGEIRKVVVQNRLLAPKIFYQCAEPAIEGSTGEMEPSPNGV